MGHSADQIKALADQASGWKKALLNIEKAKSAEEWRAWQDEQLMPGNHSRVAYRWVKNAIPDPGVVFESWSKQEGRAIAEPL